MCHNKVKIRIGSLLKSLGFRSVARGVMTNDRWFQALILINEKGKLLTLYENVYTLEGYLHHRTNLFCSLPMYDLRQIEAKGIIVKLGKRFQNPMVMDNFEYYTFQTDSKKIDDWPENPQEMKIKRTILVRTKWPD